VIPSLQHGINVQGSTSPGLNASKVFSALGYNVLAVVPTQGLSLLRGIILARLLTPEAFGIFGIAWMTIEALTAISNFNLKNLLITLPFDQKGLRNRWLDGVWLMEIMRGTLVFIAVWALASLASSFYGTPDLYPLLIMSGFAIFIAGFTNSAFTLYEREIEYKRIVIFELLVALTGFCTTIGLTFWRRDATVFVWGMISANLFKVVMSFIWHHYRPTWRFDKEILKKCLGYGKYFLIIGFLTYITTQFDNLVLGKYMGLANLGIYLVSYKLAMMPVDLMSQVVNRVALPAYAKLYRDDPGNCFEKWSTNFICLGWVFAASSIALCVGGDYFISLIYGPKWVPPMGVFYTLIGAGLFRGLVHISVSMVLAVNRPDIDAKAKIVETVVFVLLVLLLVPRFGMLGAGFSGLLCYGMALVFRTYFLLSLSSGMRLKLAAGLARLVLGVGLLIGSINLLEALSVPFVIRLGLVVLLVPCIGMSLEPLLREYMRLVLNGAFLQHFTRRFEPWKAYFK
jgi:O-antigen/teichoic acid export membrane protein